jgi:hypothetical protein
MRTLVALLLLANLGFLVLAQGWLQPYFGLATQHEREPQRLAAQIHPEAVRIRAAAPPASAPTAPCIEAGPFSVEQIEAAEAALAPALQAPATWQRLPVEAAVDAREPQFRLRVVQPNSALREQLQGLVAATPGAGLAACAAAR